MIIVEPGGPATILVPTEQVRILAVDLPFANRAKRVAALPFAVEDMIADPLDAVHLALGDEIAPRRFLVGVVRHEVMAAWIETAEESGLDHAALVPDALALPLPDEGQWTVDLADTRAAVRSGDGTGFACPAPMLHTVWEAAGRPPAHATGAPLPIEMAAAPEALVAEGLAARLLKPALDLRQGIYARRRAASPTLWRRLGWIVALGAAAHVVIATADTLMLRSIADRREAETRALVATVAPGATLGDDLATSVTDLLPVPGGAPDAFLPLLNRISGALQPLSGVLAVQAMTYQADTLTLDLAGTDPGLAGRVEAALRGARVIGTVTRSPDGGIRVTARR